MDSVPHEKYPSVEVFKNPITLNGNEIIPYPGSNLNPFDTMYQYEMLKKLEFFEVSAEFFEEKKDHSFCNIDIPKEIILPEELEHCRELFDYIQHSEPKVHPYAVFAAFNIIMSAFTSRWVYTSTGASTALYNIIIAPTGSGKNVAMNTVEYILNTLNENNDISLNIEVVSSRITSLGSLDDIFKINSVIINLVDEFGDQLEEMKKGPQKQLASSIKKLYASSITSTYKTGYYSTSGGKNKVDTLTKAVRPFYSILGITTKEQFLDAVNIKMLNDGFINRFIIINGDGVKPLFNHNPVQTLPECILNHIKTLNIKVPILPDMTEEIYDGENSYKIIELSNEAAGYYESYIGDADIPNTDIYRFCNESEDIDDKEKVLRRNISIRWRENALRYATALTAYETRNIISIGILEYSYKIVKSSGIEFLRLFHQEKEVSNLEKYMECAYEWFCKKEEELFMQAKEKGQRRILNTIQEYTITYISRNMYCLKKLKGRERRQVLEELVIEGILMAGTYKNGSKRSITTYCLANSSIKR